MYTLTVLISKLLLVIIYKNISIHAGEKEVDELFPWLIQYHSITPCGGVLLAPDWILTAAQCVNIKRYAILLHSVGLNKNTSKPQNIGVKATYIHPEFDSYSTNPDYHHNIALIKLYKPLTSINYENGINEKIFLKIKSKNFNDYEHCMIFGWESDILSGYKIFTKPIKSLETKIVKRGKACLTNTVVNHLTICAVIKTRNGEESCAGNPGSPIVCRNKYEPDNLSLLGIASWTNFSLFCNEFATYLDVTYFRSWIDSVIFMDKNPELDYKQIRNNSLFEYQDNRVNEDDLVVSDFFDDDNYNPDYQEINRFDDNDDVDNEYEGNNYFDEDHEDLEEAALFFHSSSDATDGDLDISYLFIELILSMFCCFNLQLLVVS